MQNWRNIYIQFRIQLYRQNSVRMCYKFQKSCWDDVIVVMVYKYIYVQDQHICTKEYKSHIQQRRIYKKYLGKYMLVSNANSCYNVSCLIMSQNCYWNYNRFTWYSKETKSSSTETMILIILFLRIVISQYVHSHHHPSKDQTQFRSKPSSYQQVPVFCPCPASYIPNSSLIPKPILHSSTVTIVLLSIKNNEKCILVSLSHTYTPIHIYSSTTFSGIFVGDRRTLFGTFQRLNNRR